MNPESMPSALFLYGPPGSGKSTIGKALAEALSKPFWDLDQEIENHAGMPVAEIFAIEGEEGFRAREKRMLGLLVGKVNGVVALGGGTLIDPENRARVEQDGHVVCLRAPVERLIGRLQTQVGQRPLLFEEPGETNPHDILTSKLAELLARRKDHYTSFSQFDVNNRTPEEAAWEIQVQLGRFYVSGMGRGYDAIVQRGGLNNLGAHLLSRGLRGPVALVSDRKVGDLYAPQTQQALGNVGLTASPVLFPAGEWNKNLDTVSFLWDAFLEAQLERSSTVVALGGGVVGDLAGFAAAVYLRGIPWVVVPTTLLAMADASLGGKTGVDLPQGKNLVGAFHAPHLVLADTDLLATLEEAELRSGMAEVVKAAVIGDPILYEICSSGWGSVRSDWGEVVRRAMAVKIKVIQKDPFESGLRASLNLGHTIGHAVELVSGFELRHGEAVSIGMVAEARLAEEIGIAQPGLAESLIQTLSKLDLPVRPPIPLDRSSLIQAIGYDKKRAGGKVLFALPASIGKVQVGCGVDELEKLFRVLWK